ncbi:MAG: J domain-containing protein [Chloroherpetonaceae bacterium]|nr:J domain-containing protein [Chloroherpetonaceae bacterium]MDW8020043.1 J domain-containing protein [Chloroherpetonaceae bacterium]
MSVLSRLVKVLKAYHNAQFRRANWKELDLDTLLKEIEAQYSRARKKVYESYQTYAHWHQAQSSQGYSHTYAGSQQQSGYRGAWNSSAYQSWQHSSGTAASIDPNIAGYYANLEIPYGSDLETVRRAWRRLVALYHPDKFAGDPEKQRIATELTKGINRAYEELTKHLSKK